jgi:hypothetical protein
MGNVAAVDGVLAADAAADLLAVDVVSLAVDPQPARAAAQAPAIPKIAAERRGILTEGYFLPRRREGRRGRRRPMKSALGRPGRIALPTRADVVCRAGVDLAETLPGADRHSCGTAPE